MRGGAGGGALRVATNVEWLDVSLSSLIAKRVVHVFVAVSLLYLAGGRDDSALAHRCVWSQRCMKRANVTRAYYIVTERYCATRNNYTNKSHVEGILWIMMFKLIATLLHEYFALVTRIMAWRWGERKWRRRLVCWCSRCTLNRSEAIIWCPSLREYEDDSDSVCSIQVHTV